MAASDPLTTAGIPDPDERTAWLVRPWPVNASFCEVVRHFLRAYVWRLMSDPSPARQLAYFEGYQAALAAASTHELTYAADWHWRDDLMACIADCINVFSSKQPPERPPNFNASTSRPVPCADASADSLSVSV